VVQVDALLEEVSSDAPCGPDLEYDPEFLELDQASRGKPEQQYGDKIIPGEEPDWADVARRAEALLRRSKDLRVAVLLARALVRTEQFAGLRPGLDLIRQLLERFWDGAHPRLDEEDGDPTMRLNALAALADPNSLLRDLRQSALVRSRTHGQILVREIEVARQRLAPRPDESPLAQSHIDGVLAAVAGEGGFSLAEVEAARESARALAGLLNDRVGSDRAPDLRPVMATLDCLKEAAAGALPAALPVGEAAEGGVGPGGAAPGVINVASGEIASRQDALLLVDKIITYFERHEPSNPAPLLLARAKRLMTMNFVDIIKDLVPDGMDRIQTIAGLPSEE